MRFTIIFTILLMCLCANIQAQDYKVNVETSLNVRSSANGKQIGSLNSGDIVRVYEIKDGWAQIFYKGSIAYVGSDYLSVVAASTPSPRSSSFSLSSLSALMDELPWDMKGVGKPILPIGLIFLILGLQIFLVVMRKLEDRDVFDIEGPLLMILTFVFLCLCIIEIYAMFNFSELNWFCSPSHVGWIATIINFPIYAVVLYMQAMNALYFLYRLQYMSTGVDIKIGLYSYGITLLLLMFTQNSIFILLFFIAQIVQCGKMMYYNRDTIGFGAIQCLVYLLGSFSLMAIFLPFIPLLLIAAVLYVIVMIFGDGGKSSRCGNCQQYDGSYCYYKRQRMSSWDSCNKFRSR